MEEIIDLIYHFRSEALWEVLANNDIFAVQLAPDRIGYVSILGGGRQTYGLVLYKGEDGWNSLLRAQDWEEYSDGEDRFMTYMSSGFECLTFGSASDSKAPSSFKTMVRGRCKAMGYPINGCFPSIYRKERYFYNKYLTTEEEMADLRTALLCALSISQLITHVGLAKLGFYPGMGIVDQDTQRQVMPLVTPLEEGDEFRVSQIDVPLPGEDTLFDIPFNDTKKIAKFRKMEGTFGIDCRLFPMDYSIQDNKNDTPYIPFMLFGVSSGDSFPIMYSQGKPDKEGLGKMLDEISGILANDKPQVIRVDNRKTYSLLKDFCRKCGIRLAYTPKLEGLEEAVTLFRNMSKYMDDM